MIFDAARKAGWAPTQRLDHIGFGVVCGDDGKRFRTRLVFLFSKNKYFGSLSVTLSVCSG
jgi:hypothetical protein